MVAGPPTGVADPYRGLRRVLLALVLLTAIGLAIELFLLEHTESLWQIVPFFALGLTAAASIAVAVTSSRPVVQLYRLIMTLLVLVGLVGIYLHLRGNVEFELEMNPSATGMALLWEALRGATPAMAPGAIAQLGLLGLASTLRHPAGRRRGRTPGDDLDTR